MKKILKLGLLAGILSLVLALPTTMGASATDGSDDVVDFRFGKNFLTLSNNTTNETATTGLLFALGNQLQMDTSSSYAFVAGNIVNISSEVDHDLFIAANILNFNSDLLVDGDIFAAASEITVESDLSGDLYAAAGSITFRDVDIDGDVSLSVDQVTFEGEVNIFGTLKYNETATISGSENLQATKEETYVVQEEQISAATIWLDKVLSIIGVIITFLLLILVFPQLKERIVRESTVERLGKDLLIGLGFTVLVPAAVLILLISYIGAPAGIVMAVLYGVGLYLAQAFAGVWLGKMIVEKLCHSRLPMIVEAIIGVLIFGCCSMIPYLSLITNIFSVLIGTGTLVACFGPRLTAKTETVSTKTKKK